MTVTPIHHPHEHFTDLRRLLPAVAAHALAETSQRHTADSAQHSRLLHRDVETALTHFLDLWEGIG